LRAAHTGDAPLESESPTGEGRFVLKGFRDFIVRGNIIDLAVGVVIGVAFTSLVTDFTTDFINPLIRWAGGGNQLSSSTRIPGTTVIFQWGNFISAAINFLIVAAVLYFLVVLPINKLNSLRKRNAAAVEVPVDQEIALLTEIRDALLRANAPIAPGQRVPAHHAADDDVADAPTALR
jgi:large conductance mechanosensitive channel